MSINSSCLRVGPIAVTQRVLSLLVLHYRSQLTIGGRSSVPRAGLHFVKSRSLKCSLDEAKRGFFRATNAIFGKVGRVASEEVVLELVKCKCLPILLYGLECCPLNKSDVKSLYFAVTRFLMKLFKSVNLDLINECRLCFNFSLPSELLETRIAKFQKKDTNVLAT